jgi:homoserine kinase type II
LAVYASLDDNDFALVAREFGLGAFQGATGIPQGSINTNYRIECAAGRFFLRHCAIRSEADLRFEADLLAHLQESAFPAPHLLRTARGEPFLELRGGRVSVFSYLSGEELTRAQLTTDHVERLGATLGKLHRVTNSFGGNRANPYGPEQVSGWLRELAQHPDPSLAEIARELQRYLETSQLTTGELVPRGVIHADLFMDNVKWLGDRVSAFFDFEMACRDAFTLDVAITLNAWCFDGEYKPDLCQALVRGYQLERRLQSSERDDLFHQALYGAVRYTASRIRDFHLSPLPPDKLFKKDFRTYLARARALTQMKPSGFLKLLGL